MQIMTSCQDVMGSCRVFAMIGACLPDLTGNPSNSCGRIFRHCHLMTQSGLWPNILAFRALLRTRPERPDYRSGGTAGIRVEGCASPRAVAGY